MSNNKQSMKLYTEEQMRKALRTYFDLNKFLTESDVIKEFTPIELPSDSLCINCDESKSTHNVCMDCMIKIGKENIELPSDDEMSIRALKTISELNPKLRENEEAFYIAGFVECAKWMRDKIGGNNEQ